MNMFTVIGTMFAGAILGYLLKNRKFLKFVPNGTMITIIILLFVMGAEIGGNKEVMGNIVSLGSQGVLISSAATLGSVLLSWVVYFLVFKSKTSEKKEVDNE